MATIAQLDANRLNAQASTGPITETGKQTSSRNALTFGLYTREDHVKPDEHEIYAEFCQTMYRELCPASLLEETLTAEITGASWRLRRCASAEGELENFDESSDKIRRSIERARAAATFILHRSINQLRRLQTERKTDYELMKCEPFDDRGLADSNKVFLALNARDREDRAHANFHNKPLTIAQLEALTAPPTWPSASAPTCIEHELASFCKPAPQTPRNAPCPCKSGEKFKRCCGKNAPPVLTTEAA